MKNWTLFCSSGKSLFSSRENKNMMRYLDLNEKNPIHRYFLDNSQTINHHSITYGIRQLDSLEMNCINRTLPSLTKPLKFSADYKIRIYQSGCFYLDANNYWQSKGLLVRIVKTFFII